MTTGFHWAGSCGRQLNNDSRVGAEDAKSGFNTGKYRF